MNKKILKNAAAFLMLLALVAPGLVLAQNDPNAAGTYFPTNGGDINLPGQTNTLSPVQTITNIINIFLGLLGLLAVIIVMIGGFKWMTAQGSDDKVKDAKKTIQYGVIGLAIILLAYVIVRLVMGAIINVGNGGTNIT
jgi:cytochrome bd-type quinol oxidase subunit 2